MNSLTLDSHGVPRKEGIETNAVDLSVRTREPQICGRHLRLRLPGLAANIAGDRSPRPAAACAEYGAVFDYGSVSLFGATCELLNCFLIFQLNRDNQASSGADDPGSWNRYGYVCGDPAGRVDSQGSQDCTPSSGIDFCVTPSPPPVC